ncbi:MAG TPA: IS1595 family transposase [Fimbriimonadaceae bacterium]|jgi:transposase-like protein
MSEVATPPFKLNAEFPRTLREYETRFATEEACREHLFNIRWPEGFICPKCKRRDTPWKLANRDIFVCRHCEHHASLKAGTLFHKSKRPLTDWFRAIYFVAENKQTISALTLMRYMGCKLDTAWTWIQKIRELLGPDDSDGPLFGEVELDEAFFGGVLPNAKPGLGSANKIVVAFAIERRGRHSGRVRAKVLPNRTGPIMQAFVESTVVTGSYLISDAAKQYASLAKKGYVLDSRECYHRGQAAIAKGGEKLATVHLKCVNRAISLIKRIIFTTHQGSFSGKHLQKNIDEFVFRYNRRDPKARKPEIPLCRAQELLYRGSQSRCSFRWMIIGRPGPKTPIRPVPKIRPWSVLWETVEGFNEG